MKNISFFKYAMMAVTAIAMLGFYACSDDDDDVEPDEPPVFVEDGFYVTGEGTALHDLDFAGLMMPAVNEADGNNEREGLFELFIAVEAGSEGFHIVQVAGEEQITHGPGDDFGIVPEEDRHAEEPVNDYFRGSLVETETPFTVNEDALYHVAIDLTLETVMVIHVNWGVVGAATPDGWGGSTELPHTGFDLETMTFTGEIPMTVGDFKFRHSNNWKAFFDAPDYEVSINTNYGTDVDDLEPGGPNIINEESGLYEITMVWTLGEEHEASMEKTGDLDAVDYTDVELGLVGESLVVDGEPHNWDETIMLHTPEVIGDNEYLWTYPDVEVAAGGGGFKIREGQDWDGYSFGMPQVNMAGTAADNFETNDDGNFVALEDGAFDIEFHIDALSEEMTFTIHPAGEAPELYMLGDATEAGWDNEEAIPMEGSDGEYHITANLLGDGEIKFITTLGQWQPQYGTDETGTSEGGPLFVNEGDSDDPDGIPGPAEAGTYHIEVDTNNMTYTITPE